MKNKVPVVARVFACALPGFEETLDPNQRDLYHWLTRIPEPLIPMHLAAERDRIVGETETQRYEQQAACERSRLPEPVNAQPRLHLRVTTQLGVQHGSADSETPRGLSSRVNIPFDPDSGPRPPEPPPPIPFELVHYVERWGLNDYSRDTTVAFEGDPTFPMNGLGPWAGGWVVVNDSLNRQPMAMVPQMFRQEVRIQNELIFNHWASLKPWRHPAPPPAVMARVEPYQPDRLEIKTSTPFDANQIPGRRGHGFKIYSEFTHVPGGASDVRTLWLEYGHDQWQVHESGGIGIDARFTSDFPFQAFDSLSYPDGLWRHRVCAAFFQRPATEVEVSYDGRLLEQGVTAIAAAASEAYVPGVSTGIAYCEETIQVFTLGATKAHSRVLDIQPVPGFGLLVTLRVINDFHIEAGIAAPFYAGCDLDGAVRLAPVMVVRNLPPHRESEPIRLLLPARVRETGDRPFRFQHLGNAFWRGFAMPPTQTPNGIYGQRGPYPELFSWPPPAWSARPQSGAVAYGVFNTHGERFWQGDTDGAGERVVDMLPIRRAPGPELSADYGEGYPGPHYSEAEPFVMVFDWSVEERVAIDPEVWEQRTARHTMTLGRVRAVERYGRVVQVDTARGRPLWLPYHQSWSVAFEAWSGGDVDELEAYLIEHFKDIHLRWRQVRNFQFTVKKRPTLISGLFWHFENEAFIDEGFNFNAAVVVKEYASADTVDIAFTARRDF